MSNSEIAEYVFHDTNPTWGSQYIWPALRGVIQTHAFSSCRAFELGCGNGAAANMLSMLGFDVMAVDPSESGIAQAKGAYPQCKFARASGYEDLAGRFGRFELVVSIEVLQHCANPKKIVQTLFDLVEPGGLAIISVTYHGYLKYLVLALTGRLDHHLNALWDTGPLKFFSKKTFRILLQEAGFQSVVIHLVGRVPPFAKSMVAIAYRRV
jgi:2-polyprenyl-6-hydroxyphenyl methylase/3-demethylubiquinone-9 3-methyltransferase